MSLLNDSMDLADLGASPGTSAGRVRVAVKLSRSRWARADTTQLWPLQSSDRITVKGQGLASTREGVGFTQTPWDGLRAGEALPA